MPRLTAQDICTNVKECAKSKVTLLKFGELEISFGVGAPETAPIIPPEKATVIAMEEVATKSFLNEELKTRDEQLAMLMIENPVEAEKMLLAGELEEEEEYGIEAEL